jgi:hypothetical protein
LPTPDITPINDRTFVPISGNALLRCKSTSPTEELDVRSSVAPDSTTSTVVADCSQPEYEVVAVRRVNAGENCAGSI